MVHLSSHSALQDPYLSKHQNIESVPNLGVMMLARSLESKGYLSNIFSWKWNYYFLTDEGVKFLQQSLGLPAEVFPTTYKKSKQPQPKVADDEKEEKPGRSTDQGESRGAMGRGRGSRH